MSEPASRASRASARRGEAIGICASTGGPAVLTELLGALPADFPLPLLVVQHIASGFVDGLVRMLDDAVALPVAPARDDTPLRPGVWLAPDDAHLTLTPARRTKLDRETVRGRHRPSADLLLESLADVLGAGAVAVVLTGMGRDGAEGAAAVQARGGLVLAQDEASSSIYGMPRAAVQAGARPLPPRAIAAALRELSPGAAMSDQLEQLADLVRDRSGIVLHGRHRIHSLAAALAKLEPGLDAATALRRARHPVAGRPFVAALLEAVAVHETFFFRQRDDLDAIDWRALLAAAGANGSLAVRAWVAGCSTGEEAYTLALLATEALGDPPPLSLLATDLSAAALRRAERARYGPRAVRHVEAGLRERRFERAGDELAVAPSLRGLVRFRQHNLVTDPPPDERFELILCRNVLIYFDAPTVERVVRSLERALAPGGMLLLGAADRLCRLPDPGRATPRRARGAAPWRARLRRPAGEPVADAAPRRSWRTPSREPAAAAPPATPTPTSPTADGPAPLAAALAAADAGRMDEALAATERALAVDPLDADAHYIRGVAQLGAGDGPAAAESLRRALYVDPGFALAAFQLGRAYDLLGDEPAARRAYEQALRTLSPDHERQQRLVAGVDLADVASACGARLAALSRAS